MIRLSLSIIIISLSNFLPWIMAHHGRILFVHCPLFKKKMYDFSEAEPGSVLGGLCKPSPDHLV